jgi:intein/homing endonuclease
VTRATLLVNGTLRATPNHPFFANGRWVTAGELGVGDILLEASEDGRTVVRVPVRSIERLPGGVEVFNLEVAGVHDYFADGLLVHNKPLTCSTGCL